MTLASVLALIAAVVAVCVTILHGWIFALRRSDRAHLWLAVTGLGVAGMGVGDILLRHGVGGGGIVHAVEEGARPHTGRSTTAGAGPCGSSSW